MSQPCVRCQRILDLPGPAAFCPYCGQSLEATVTSDSAPSTAPSASVTSDMPERLGEYRLVRQLGRGGMGVVYEGEHEPTGRRVAVKLVDVRASNDALQRFRQEGKLASAVSHPRCVFVFAADQDAGRPFIVLELMPGRTLDDLVHERGPLPVGEAIAHALDLIDGLEQVHALGVIHRDVKPSNCFLDNEGRIKVGDFGLARSLAPEAKLTRTGTFVGTPLFASPEQIKAQPLDARADVYAVCATLYYLLAGKAPHEGADGDSMAVMARVVSEDAPPVRSRRREVPPGLERVLARGLARERDRRFADLGALRAELAAFTQAGAGWRTLGSRYVAYGIIDTVLLAPVGMGLTLLEGGDPFSATPSPLMYSLDLMFVLAYFGVSEGVWGASVGKWLLGLRVCRAGDIGPPGVAAGFGRALACLSLFGLPHALVMMLVPGTTPESTILMGVLQLGITALAVVAMLCTVRRRNGYACLHDLMSGTRVVVAPARQVAVRFPARPARTDMIAAGEEFGPFRVLDELWSDGGELMSRAIDPTLDRVVWLWQRPPDRPAVPAARREAYSGARPRWLAHGEKGGRRWDAFLIPGGAPLAETVAARGPLDWEQARPLLEQLADALEKSADEDALAERYSLSQVWLTPEGRVVLVDLPAPGTEPLSPGELVHEAAVALLEGEPRPGAELPRARIPGHARRLLSGLRTAPDPLAAFREGLAATSERPARLTRGVRLMHLSLLAMVQMTCCGGFTWMVAFQGVFVVSALNLQLEDGRAILAEVDAVRVAGLAAEPGLGSAWSLHQPPAQRKRLAAALARAEQYRAARLARLAPPMRSVAAGEAKRYGDYREPGPLLARAKGMAMALEELEGLHSMTPVVLVLTAVPVVVCVLSALAFRGGVRYPLLGVDVVRGDGRPAGRLRCAWRALMAWLPILAPLVVARWLEESYWRQWTPEGGPEGLLVLANVCWLLVIVVPLAYLLTILVTPGRGPHDRLAGTWLVPR